MKTVTIEIPDFVYAEAQRISDRMNETLPNGRTVNSVAVVCAAIFELGYTWPQREPERDIARVVPRDYARGEV